MARSASTVWEARTTGSDTNGGGFRAGASGTDYTQQDSPQVSVTDAVTNGTTTITSATASFASAHVGNLVYVSGGTGSVAADRYEVTSVTNSTTIVVDRSTGLTAGTGVTLKLGGAITTFAELSDSTRGMIAGNKAWIKGGTYSVTAAITFAQTLTPGRTVPPSQLIGYASARGDITETSSNQSSRPEIVVNAALGVTAFSLSGAGWHLRNLVLSKGTGSFTNGFGSGQGNLLLHNCKASGFTTNGFNITGATSLIAFCEASGGGSTSIGIAASSSGTVERCYVHDSLGVGIQHAGSGDVLHCIVANLTGANSDAIQLTSAGSRAIHNTVYNAARHGVNVSTPNWTNRVRGNILASNGGYGLTNATGAGLAASPELDGNAYYNNSSGPRNNVDDTGSINPVDASAPYSNAYDVLLASPNDPFANAAGGDFSLNNTAGRGALLRGTAPMNLWPVLSTTGYRDFGAIQHQESSSVVMLAPAGPFSHIREH